MIRRAWKICRKSRHEKRARTRKSTQQGAESEQNAARARALPLFHQALISSAPTEPLSSAPGLGSNTSLHHHPPSSTARNATAQSCPGTRIRRNRYVSHLPPNSPRRHRILSSSSSSLLQSHHRAPIDLALDLGPKRNLRSIIHLPAWRRSTARQRRLHRLATPGPEIARRSLARANGGFGCAGRSGQRDGAES